MARYCRVIDACSMVCLSTYAGCIADTSVYVCINSHLRPDNKVDTRGGHVVRFGGRDLIHRSPRSAGQEIRLESAWKTSDI